jgi:GH3 auxin-responsive promoter
MILKCPRLFNEVWSLSSRSGARSFESNLGSVEKTQRSLLRSILAHNQDCGYGKAYTFGEIGTAETYRDRVPAVDYADLETWIRLVAKGENALTNEKTLLLEPTSGSQHGSKFIPYTASLRKDFQRGIAPWIHSLFRRHPGAKKGSAYWSLTPPLNKKPPYETSIPVGFQSDAEYLGPFGRWMESQVFAVPSSVLRGTNPDSFLYRTALHLLAAKDLAFISIWNPSFLTILLDGILADFEPLLRDIHDAGNIRRTRELEAAAKLPQNLFWQRVWPRLALISCWQDGWARGPYKRLADTMHHVNFQAKGLLATEGFISFPFYPRDSANPISPLQLLAYPCHFFEFADVESGMTRFAWEVETGKTYSALITTSGGLYRYRLRDLVRIEGFHSSCPILRFIAKEESLSDLTGEKLQSEFVQGCVDRLLKEWGLEGRFYVVAPEPNLSPPRYHCYACLEGSEDKIPALEMSLEQSLEDNFHYSLSRRLGQLGAIHLIPMDKDAEARYYFFKSQNAKLGDIKWKPLESHSAWSQILGVRVP